MISLCMIVKNEEEGLGKSLQSIPEFIDEIIIVDTGSTDKTIEIARMHTDKVFYFEWCCDFAAARNFSLLQASNDWVLVLDADEVIQEYQKDSILKFIQNKSNEKVIGRIKRINPYEDRFGEKKLIERVSRVFNKKYFHYDGIIHEQIVALTGKDYKSVPLDIIVNHIGYKKEVLNRTNKIERNLTLLKKAIEDNKRDPYLYYQLGKTYFMAKDYENAIVNFSKGIEFLDNFAYEYASDLVESYGYTLLNLEKYNDALQIENYKKYYGSLPDYNFLMGLIYMNTANFQIAAESFLKCTESKEGKIEGITTYLPLYNIGVIFESLGYKDEAIEYYRMCGNYELALNRLRV